MSCIRFIRRPFYLLQKKSGFFGTKFINELPLHILRVRKKLSLDRCNLIEFKRIAKHRNCLPVEYCISERDLDTCVNELRSVVGIQEEEEQETEEPREMTIN